MAAENSFGGLEVPYIILSGGQRPKAAGRRPTKYHRLAFGNSLHRISIICLVSFHICTKLSEEPRYVYFFLHLISS